MNKTKPSNFLNISPEECGSVFPSVIHNAQKHFRCADILAAAKEYPNAIAHLILGTEELIKALALLLEAKGFHLRSQKEYKQLFSSHRARHSLIKEFYSVILFFKKLAEIEQKPADKHWFMYGLKVTLTGLEGVLDAGKNYEWWEQADRLKQHCFYIDYEDGPLLPNRLGQVDYENASKFVDAFQKDARVIMVALHNLQESKGKHLQEAFHKADLPALLSGTIRRSGGK